MIEMLAGLIVLVPVVLFLLDLGVLVLANTINDKVAKSAARAAANQQNLNLATQAANKAMEKATKSPIITDFALEKIDYIKDDRVIVQTRIDVRLPVPFPFLDNKPKFKAQAVEPIVTFSE